ncbi:glycosyltransferase family 1 protein [Hwanghaeella grinnelliae]|uniref:Glycosyltransferase family 1 protein n=1 Tax=Hwanghaeella grinnelliae TaxID=2500179 RepID=A0A3S3URV8_9PROT|nr:glycosyltransferase family 4 protein [Hwanghaeella grinnelliae]RVU39151.1 glycosyltransferase family 1 protein [Hwanghaeella grinnelliae]
MAQNQTIHFIFPGDPDTRTGGYAYGREIVAAMRRAGAKVQVVALPDGFPVPTDDIRRRAAGMLAEIPDGAAVIFDGLACGVLPEETAALSARTRLTALVHHPLADESGLEESESRRLFESEKQSLTYARHVIVTSGYTALRLRDFGVEDDRVTVIEPGTEAAPLARGTYPDGPVSLLAVASVTPRKGYPDLLQALKPLGDLDWRLDCVGGLEMSPAHARGVLAKAADFGDRVRFHGALPPDALPPLYDSADLFVSPSHYEGYGMAIAEAAACGLPILAASGGAVPFTTAGRAARLIKPGDISGLSAALKGLIGDPKARQGLREASLAARKELPTWDDSGMRCFLLMRGLAKDDQT